MPKEQTIREIRSIAEKVKDNVKYHLVDSTALLTESTPVFAAYEIFIVGMSLEVSINTRLIAAGSSYAGLGYLYCSGRDFSRKILNVSDKTSEGFKQLHDMTYTGVFNLIVSPVFYFAAGETDTKNIALGTACAIGLGAINGGPLGYAVDLFRDLTGLEESKRIPELVRGQNSVVKKGLAALLVGGAIALTSAIYSETSHSSDVNYQQTTPEVRSPVYQ